MSELEDEAPGDRWAELAAALARDEDDGRLPDETGATLAAVLLLLYDKDSAPHIVLTRRTNHVAAHKGEISLPGGAYEEDKDLSLLHTALREAAEEVGIEAAGLRILGRLPLVYTMSSNFAIMPYVAATPQRPSFYPDPIEVAEVLEVPLEALRDPAALQEEDWDFDGMARRIWFYAHGEYKIWGATARILSEFLAVLEKVTLRAAGANERGGIS